MHCECAVQVGSVVVSAFEMQPVFLLKEIIWTFVWLDKRMKVIALMALELIFLDFVV
jgi:hypothetical protein